MRLYEFNPIKELTLEVIKSIKIHTTISSFRNYISNKVVNKVDATDKVPTLYYVHLSDGNRLYWEINALAIDLTRFLLVHSIKSEEE